MDKIEAPEEDNSKVSFTFPQPQRSGQRVIRLEGIHQAYGQNVVYRGLDFEAERGQRIVLVGPNGAGKSTLLKILGDAIKPQAFGFKLRCISDTLHVTFPVLIVTL